MSYYEAFLNWWYNNGAQENTKVVIVNEAEFKHAITKLTPPPQKFSKTFAEPQLFMELKSKTARMRYQRNLKMFNSRVLSHFTTTTDVHLSSQ